MLPRNRNLKMPKQSGVAMLLVILCMIIITTMIGAMLRHLTLANQQMKQRMHQIQATWLAESGVERAVFAIQQDADLMHPLFHLLNRQRPADHAGAAGRHDRLVQLSEQRCNSSHASSQ